MNKALMTIALALAVAASQAAELHLGDLLKSLFGSALAAQSSDPLPAGNPDATITSGIYALRDKHGSHAYRIKDIGRGRALVAYEGESGDRHVSGSSVSASLAWAVATAGGAAWTVSHAENDQDRDCRIRFIAHAQSINVQEHDCDFAGKASPPKDATLKFAGPLQGGEFAEVEAKLGWSVSGTARSGPAASPDSPVRPGTLVGRTFQGPHTLLDQFKNTQTLDFGGEGPSRRVVHVGETGGEKHVVVLVNRGSDWLVSADMAIAASTRGLTFVGTNDASDYAPGIGCAVDGRRVVAFGFMRPSGRSYLSAGADLVWSLDTSGRPVPVKGTQVICR